MAHRVCPWWLGYLLASPVRRWLADPVPMLQPYVRTGMTVFEPGPGMGFFTIDLARMVGPSGRVIVSELQPKMLEGLRRRTARAGVSERIEFRQATADSLAVADLAGRVDFVLVFAMVHEVPDQPRLFAQLFDLLRPGGRMLVAEPRGHVPDQQWRRMLGLAADAGFGVGEAGPVRRSHAAVVSKPAASA